MKSNISQPFFQISEANIISRGISNGHEYIVYCSDKGVNVNTDFKKIGKDMYNCCSYYDRNLCDTISKFEEMSKEKIESQAYGSWMDGAHSLLRKFLVRHFFVITLHLDRFCYAITSQHPTEVKF